MKKFGMIRVEDADREKLEKVEDALAPVIEDELGDEYAFIITGGDARLESPETAIMEFKFVLEMLFQEGFDTDEERKQFIKEIFENAAEVEQT